MIRTVKKAHPAHVHVSSQEGSDVDRHDLCGVSEDEHGIGDRGRKLPTRLLEIDLRDCHSLESTPRETQKNVTGKQHGKVDGKEL